MSSLSDLICGTFGRSYRSLLSRAVKIGAPTTGVVGLAADLGTPVATFVPWLAVAAALVTGTTGLVWFGGYRRKLSRALADGRITQSEIEHATEHNVWSVGFAFGLVSTVVLGSLMGAQQLAAEQDKGVLATVVPGLEQLQATVLRIDKNVLATKEATARVEVKTDAVLEKLEDMNASFEKAAKGGAIIANPSTPAEHYHNARLYEVKADFAGARRSYNAYLESGVEYIDPYLAYVDMLKVQDGLEGAREITTAMRRHNRTVSLEVAASLLLPKEQRIAALRQVLDRSADFAPAAFLLSREYSSDKLGEQTLAEKREEMMLLERFRALDKAGKFQRHLIDKKLAKDWLELAESRLAQFATLSPAAIETPVTLTAKNWGDRWDLELGLADDNIKSIEYRLDGQGDFKSTGFLDWTDPKTGRAPPRESISVGALAPGDHILEVRYTDMRDKVNGPFTLRMNTFDAAIRSGKAVLESTADSWVEFSDHMGNRTLLYFSHLVGHKGILKAIKYSFDGDALNREFAFSASKPGQRVGAVGDEPTHIEPPAGVKSVSVQLTFLDGSQSEIKRFARRYPPATAKSGVSVPTSGREVIFKHAGSAEPPEQFIESTETSIVGKVVRDKDPGGWKYELQAKGKPPIRILYEGSDSFSKVLASLEEKELVVSVSGVVGTFPGGYMAFETSKPIVIAKGN
ncbi:MAG TPA: hypothetical protein PKJ45_10130 [Rubrivivax sp.]|nr:hypothetical protein [Rubrivivax sp.]